MAHGIRTNDQMFSVREVPWHGLGVVLDEYPKSIDDALDKAGLGWEVMHGDILVVKAPEWTDDFGTKHAAEVVPASGFKANLRNDTGEVLGIVGGAPAGAPPGSDSSNVLRGPHLFVTAPLPAVA